MAPLSASFYELIGAESWLGGVERWRPL